MNTEVFAYNSIKNRHEILTKSLYAYRLCSPNSPDLKPGWLCHLVSDAGACVPDQNAWHWRAATASLSPCGVNWNNALWMTPLISGDVVC